MSRKPRPPKRAGIDPAVEERFITDKPYAMETLLRVEHRDRKGEMVPMKLKTGQLKLHCLREAIRAFRICINADLDPHKAEIWRALRFDKRDQSQMLSTRIKHILEEGVDKLLLDFKRREPDLRLSDGPVRIVVLKCRRGGFSSYLEAVETLEANFTPNYSVLTMAHRGPNAKRVFKYAADFHKFWNPEFIQYRRSSESESKDGYSFDNNSRFTVATAGSRDAARGDQHDAYHLSETAFYSDYDAVRASLSSNPEYSSVYEESTGNGPTGGFYERYQRSMDFDDVVKAYETENAAALANWNGYFRFFYSWLEEPEYTAHVFDWESDYIKKTLDETERALCAGFPNVTIGQLKWRRQQIEKYSTEETQGMSAEQFFEQEYPATIDEVFQTTGSKYFNQRKLRRMQLRAQADKPRWCFKLGADVDPVRARADQANLHVFAPPDPTKSYAIGSDTSEGKKKGDWCTAYVLDRGDGMAATEVAFLRGKFGSVEFGDMITTLAEWYNDAFVVPEMNGPGIATCTRIVDNRYMHIYRREALDIVKDGGESSQFCFGFRMYNQSKHTVMANLQDGVSKDLILIRSKVVIDECMAFENVDGKLQAPSGGYDDGVDAAALAYYGHTFAAPPVARRDEHRISKQIAAAENKQTSIIHEAVMKAIARTQMRNGAKRKDQRPDVAKFMRSKRTF